MSIKDRPAASPLSSATAEPRPTTRPYALVAWAVVRIIAGFRGCERTAYSEVEVGSKPGKPTFGRVSKQVERVLKGLGKQCARTVPDVPKLEAAQLFPKAGE